jgi:FG-GAP-like repeat
VRRLRESRSDRWQPPCLPKQSVLVEFGPWAFPGTVVLTINTARGQRAAVERDVAAALARTEPTVAFTFRTFDQFIDATVTHERLIAMLSSFFGGVALLLAGIALYGIVAQAARTHQSEIGLRMALGAQPRTDRAPHVSPRGGLNRGRTRAGPGRRLWAAQFVGPLLFQVQARDPAAFAGGMISRGGTGPWRPRVGGILWQNPDGQLALWSMNGGIVAGEVYPGVVDSSWRVRGAGDFNGDRSDDILWQNTSGQMAIWYMSRLTPLSTFYPGSPVSADWQIQGVGDFDGDGLSDILWRDVSGAVAIWLGGEAERAVCGLASTERLSFGAGDP